MKFEGMSIIFIYVFTTNQMNENKWVSYVFGLSYLKNEGILIV